MNSFILLSVDVLVVALWNSKVKPDTIVEAVTAQVTFIEPAVIFRCLPSKTAEN